MLNVETGMLHYFLFFSEYLKFLVKMKTSPIQ